MTLAVEERTDLFQTLKFNDQGLIPAIAQQYDSGEVLMMAWMNREAIDLTLSEGIAHYWSRSRGKMWKKGETSGHIQQVKEFRLDCDGDTILLKIDQTGAACHTGRKTCFYRVQSDGRLVFDQD